MQADPLFTVVIPVYNRQELIKRAIQSVLDQQFLNWELIVVDDGSTDDTSRSVREFTDARIRYIYQENSERGAARNAGIRNALGKYVMFMDSDDYLLPDHMQTAADIIQNNQEVPRFFHLNFRTEGSSGSVVKNFPAQLNRTLVFGNPFGCTGIVVWKELLNNYKFSEDRQLAGTEDYDLWLRLAAVHPFLHFPKVTCVLYDHQQRSVTSQDPEKLETRISLFIKRSLENPEVHTFLGNDKSIFISRRYSYVALHAAMAGAGNIARRNLKHALKVSPGQLFSIRFLQVLRFMLKPMR